MDQDNSVKSQLIPRAPLAVLALVFLSLTTPGMGQDNFSEVYVENHRCLVSQPDDLAPDAPVVLILHGFGTNEEEPLGYYQQLELPPCLLVLPDGPLPVARLPAGARAWYDRFTHSRKDMEKSRDYLFEIMDYFSKDQADPPTPGENPKPRPVIILGISQGAVMALEAGLNYKGNIRAIVSMSGFIEYPEKTLAHPSAPRDTPILLIHGTWDPVIQEEDTLETMKSLKWAGYHPVLKEFKTGHDRTVDEIDEVSSFLGEVIVQNR